VGVPAAWAAMWSPMPTQLLVGPNAPSGKKTIVAAGSLTL